VDLEYSSLGAMFVPDVLTPARSTTTKGVTTAKSVRETSDACCARSRAAMLQNNASAAAGRRKRLFVEAEEWLAVAVEKVPSPSIPCAKRSG